LAAVILSRIMDRLLPLLTYRRGAEGGVCVSIV
jgi:hypothetical protein